MTMLDRMRRHKGWLKWSLALVVVAFVLLYVPDFIGGGGAGGPGSYSLSDTLASVDGRRISAGEFRRTYQNQIQAYRNAYGGEMNEQLLRQLGIDQRILQQMIDEEVALVEAERVGIRATDAELSRRIVTLPAFQENGQFIGQERYRQILRMQRPPLRPEEFEAQVRRTLVIQKLRAALTDWMQVSDAEVDEAFRNRNEKVKLEFVALTADDFREGLTATDEEAASYYDAHQEQYRVGERRKVKYLLVDMQALRERATVTPQDVERFYETNVDQFSTPAQVRASHILIRTGEGVDEAAARARAEEALAKAKAGGDFAALAKQYSQDESNNQTGGDLGLFGRGAMVPEFEEAAFALEPGQISDVVRSPFGYHVIKVTEKQDGETRPLEQVRAQIEDQLRWERAQQEAERTADQIAGELRRPDDLDRLGQARGLQVAESGFFQRDEPIAALGFAPEANATAFELAEGRVSDAIRTPQGYVFLTVTGQQEAHVPKLEEVADRVREDLLREKALEAARQKAASLAASFKEQPFARAARAAGLEVKSTELIARGSALPEIGPHPAVDAAAFALPAGGVTDPVVAGNAVVIARVAERVEVTPEEIAQGRGALREQLLNERRNRFFSAYMTRAKQRMKIDINREVLRQVVA
jgi:peptidyl-prolyl cis-trans isomerase D